MKKAQNLRKIEITKKTAKDFKSAVFDIINDINIKKEKYSYKSMNIIQKWIFWSKISRIEKIIYGIKGF